MKAWFAAHKKAAAAFLTTVVAEGTALLALNVLSGTAARDVAIAIAAAGPILSALGVAGAPANVPQ